MRAIASTVLALGGRNPTPTRIFDTVDSAVLWLKPYVKMNPADLEAALTAMC